MNRTRLNPLLAARTWMGLVLLLALLAQSVAFAKDKKKKEQPAPPVVEKPQQDTSVLVWPAPPSIGRVKYLKYFAGQKMDPTPAAEEKKEKHSWMDRLAGVQQTPTGKLKKMPFQLLGPNGMALNSKGDLFVADGKVGAIFIFPEGQDATLIGNGHQATFGLINGVAVDDDDRVFVSDGKLHRVLVLSKNYEVVDQIKENLVDPVGIAIDTENRLLYVADTQQDQVLVFDADSLKLVRRLGHAGKYHEMTGPGDFAAPTGVALDADGNVYVTDTMNWRVEIFDADGNFISQFGQHCDGYGCFVHPKGIAVDGDGHIWVADPALDVLQIFNRDGQLLGFVGGHGNLFGQFSSLVGVMFDRKTNRVFTSETYPGRVQVFQYVTEAEAEKLRKEKEAERANGTKVEKNNGTPN